MPPMRGAPAPATRVLVPLTGAKTARLGPKAAVLAGLLHHGLPVPDGFVIPGHVLASTNRQVADDLALAIHAAAHRLSVGFTEPLICRSSADVEDSASHSYAGLFKTRPNIRSHAALIGAIEDVWAGPRADLGVELGSFYGLPPSPGIGEPTDDSGAPCAGSPGPRVSVIVQRMVSPVWAGVAFTAAGSRETMCVEAVMGHGENLVQGLAPGRRFWLPRRGPVNDESVRAEGDLGGLVLVYLSHAEAAALLPGHRFRPFPGGPELRVVHIDRDAGGVNATAAGPHDGPPFALLGKLRGFCLEAEGVVGRAADVEWAIDASGQVFIVQARPITSPLRASEAGPRDKGGMDAGPSGGRPSGDRPSGGRPSATCLSGIVASPGWAEGVAWHLGKDGPGDSLVGARPSISQSPAGRRDRRPRILFALSTSPRDLPAIAASAGAVVEEMGLLSHTAILCRELGIPCLVAAYGARGAFPVGTLVRLHAVAEDGRVCRAEVETGPEASDAASRTAGDPVADTPAAVVPAPGTLAGAPVNAPVGAPAHRPGELDLANLGFGRPVPLAAIVAAALWKAGGRQVPVPRRLRDEARRIEPAGRILVWTRWNDLAAGAGASRPPSVDGVPLLGLVGAEIDRWIARLFGSAHGLAVANQLLELDPGIDFALLFEQSGAALGFAHDQLPLALPLSMGDRLFLVAPREDASALSSIYGLPLVREAGGHQAQAFGRPAGSGGWEVHALGRR